MDKSINNKIFSAVYNSKKNKFCVEFFVNGKTAKSVISKEILLDKVAQNKPFYKTDFVFVPNVGMTGANMFDALGVENGKLYCSDIMHILTAFRTIYRNSELDLSEMTDGESLHITSLIEKLIKKYIDQGGDPDKLQPKEYIDYYFCMIYYDADIKAVDDFVNNYQYDPDLPKQPVYYTK